VYQVVYYGVVIAVTENVTGVKVVVKEVVADVPETVVGVKVIVKHIASLRVLMDV
jgi:hypothetical protein